jgi:hypothetical protein
MTVSDRSPVEPTYQRRGECYACSTMNSRRTTPSAHPVQWTYRDVPHTFTPGFSPAISRHLTERLRASATAGLPEASVVDAPRLKVIPGEWICGGHGRFTALAGAETTRCPWGCSSRFVRPVVVPANAQQPGRDGQGRYAARPVAAQATGTDDETMSDTEVRAVLRRVLSHCPKGSKKPLARLCGYRGKWALHTAKGVAQGRAMLPDACRRRVSRVLRLVIDGEVVLVRTGQLPTAGGSPYAWVRKNSGSSAKRVDFRP